MSEAVPPISVDAPFLATAPEAIEQMLSASKKPLDTVCGLLVTDPALLLHLLRHLASCLDQALPDYSLRHLASQWLQAVDHRWYTKLLVVRHSALSEQQRAEHRKLCSRAAIAAGLIGEWSSDDLASLRESAELSETRAVMAVLPSLMQLCRIQHGASYESVETEREAWLPEISQVLGKALAKAIKAEDSLDDPANVAVEIAAAAVSERAEVLISRKLPEWSRRLGRDAEKIQQDLTRVENGLELMADAQSRLKPQHAHSLIQGDHRSALSTHDCDSCRQQHFDNALSTIRSRLSLSNIGVSELMDHVMHAICNCGSLRRSQWYHLDENRQLLQSRRRKIAAQANPLEASDLFIAEIPMLQVLLERPRSIQVYPDIRERLQVLLPQDQVDPFEDHFLCASVFCGSIPLGVVYADADGETIGAAEAAKFKAVVQLATKVATLLALRSHRSAQTPDVSQLAYPDYASFDLNLAANERGDWQGGNDLKRGASSQ